jgi:hypothetical protein
LLTLSLIVTLTTSLAAALTSSIAYFKCCRGQASNVRAVCFGLAFAISATVASLTIFLSLWHSQPSTPWQWLVLRG